MVIFRVKNELTIQHSSSVLSRTTVKELVEGVPHRTGVSIRVEFLLNGGGPGVYDGNLGSFFSRLVQLLGDVGIYVPSAGRFSWPRLPRGRVGDWLADRLEWLVS